MRRGPSGRAVAVSVLIHGAIVAPVVVFARPPEPIRDQDSTPRDAELVLVGCEPNDDINYTEKTWRPPDDLDFETRFLGRLPNRCVPQRFPGVHLSSRHGPKRNTLPIIARCMHQMTLICPK